MSNRDKCMTCTLELTRRMVGIHGRKKKPENLTFCSIYCQDLYLKFEEIYTADDGWTIFEFYLMVKYGHECK